MVNIIETGRHLTKIKLEMLSTNILLSVYEKLAPYDKVDFYIYLGGHSGKTAGPIGKKKIPPPKANLFAGSCQKLAP